MNGVFVRQPFPARDVDWIREMTGRIHGALIRGIDFPDERN